ncbi:MAG: hypothetical protein M3Y27_31665 [Acidobacteriota bacterium]|nr:hypothetical protein [Acidobacteriota bacterium]
MCGVVASSQEPTEPKPSEPKHEDQKSEPQYEDTFSGPIVEVSSEKIVVSRSILGQPPERRTFLIKPETKIEGKLRVKGKVTVGFVTSEGVEIARLIVVRTQPKK